MKHFVSAVTQNTAADRRPQTADRRPQTADRRRYYISTNRIYPYIYFSLAEYSR